MIGDLLFFRSHGGLFDDAITLATGKPYTHVEIQVSDTESIGALTEGVVRHAIPAGADVAHVAAQIAPARLAEGLAWLARQVGHRYGWADITDDAEQLVAGKNAPVVIKPGEMCCSDLATRYLLHCGYEGLPDALFDQPELVSPHTLASALGLIK